MSYDDIKTAITTAPTFDSQGYYGAFHPNKPETKQHSLYYGLNADERAFAISFRQLGTEVPKCASYFNQGTCDVRTSHICHDGEPIHNG